MSMIARDLRYAGRLLRASPGFALAALVALALGIGATTAMFSVADAVLIRPLPYRDPDRLVQIWARNLPRNIPFADISNADVVVWRREARSFDAMAAYTSSPASLTTTGGEPEFATVARVNAALFDVFGVPPAAGRAFTADEDVPGGPRVAVVTAELWARRFGTTFVRGRILRLDGTDYQVVGVMPAGFDPPAGPVDVFVPLADAGSRNPEASTPTVVVFARLAPGATRASAQAEIDALERRLDEEAPARFSRDAHVWGLHEFLTHNVRTSVLVLGGAVVLVLLVACVNVANLLLARGSTRRRELTVRLALGAGGPRLVAQLLTESLGLGLLGGAGGVLVAWSATRAFVAIAPAGVPLLGQVNIDGAALAFALATALLTGVVFGTMPAFSLVRWSRATALQTLVGQDRGRGAAGAPVRVALIAAEMALSLVLLIGAALLGKSFDRLLHVDPGFNPDGVVTARLALRAERYGQPPARAAFYQRFVEKLESTPGVTAAGVVSALPLSGYNQGTLLVGETGAVTHADGAPVVWFRNVSKGYFRAMEIPLTRGRLFDTADETTPGAAIVNATLAARFWPGQDPIGRRLGRAGGHGPWFTVVGVVGDVHHMRLTEGPDPEIFWPVRRNPPPQVFVVLRTSLAPAGAASLLAGAAASVDPAQAISSVETMDDAMRRATASNRLPTFVIAVFAALAVALAAIGLYGVVSFLVDERRHEIGIRLALGARRADVLRIVFREGLGAALAGIACGVPAALVGTRLLGSMLFGVSARDTAIFAIVPLGLIVVAVAATWVPARRASAIDPAVTLRS